MLSTLVLRCEENTWTTSEKKRSETRLIDEIFVSVMGEYVFLKWEEPHQCLSWYVKFRLVEGEKIVVYYESRKREIKKKRKNEYRCDERLKTRPEESTCLTYTGLYEELEHLKIKNRLIWAKFEDVMGEYAI
jgi:hypothetical protein